MSTTEYPEWNAWLEEVRAAARTRLPEIVRPYIPKGGLVPAGGGQLHGFSPLRTSSGQSFYVYPEGLWHDFGLGESGDAIGFLRRRHSLGFREAIDMLATECGLATWEERKRSRGMAIADPASLLDQWAKNEAAQRVFECITAIVHKCWEMLPSMVREHLKNHYGLTDETIDFEKIGYMPHGLWKLLVNEARERGVPFDEELYLSTGMFVLGPDGYEPHLGGRILFPYWKDGLCRYTIGREFFGRAKKSDAKIEEHDQGKYKKQLTRSDKFPYVSPYVSNEILWGEDTLALVPAGEKRSTWVQMAEGITDALMLRQLGLPVVSPVTVTVSNKQAMRMALVTRGFAGIDIGNDNDTARDGSEPGKRGAKRTATIQWREGRDARIVTLPRPPGVAKVDINELVGGWLRDEGLSLDECRDRYMAIPRLTLGEQIIADWKIETMSASDAERELVDLGAIASRLTVMQHHDLMAKAISRFGRRFPRRPMQSAFLRGVTEESERRRREEVQAEVASEPERATTDVAKRALLRSPIIDELGSYERVNGDARERVSSFSLVPTRIIVSEEPGVPDRLEADVVGLDGGDVFKRWIVPANAWGSKKGFVASFPSNRMHWFGTDEEVQAVLELQTGRGTAHLPRLRATSVLGYHEVDGQGRFVLPQGTLDAAGWQETPDITFVKEGGSTLEHRMPRTRVAFDEALSELARDAVTSLPHLHEESAIVPMLAWFAALPFKPYLIDQHGGFPYLDISASPGAGKTSLLAWILWPMFCGALAGELMSATQTKFATIKDFASCNALAVVLDELKTTAMQRGTLDEQLRLARRVWSGDVETRGRADQSVRHYALAAGVCFAGETGLDEDPATAERGLHVSMNPRWLASDAGASARIIYSRLRSLPLSGLGPLFQRWSLSADRKALLGAATREADAFLVSVGRASGLAPRIRVVLISVAFGLLAFEAYATSLGVGAQLALDHPRALLAALGGTLGVDEKGELGAAIVDAFDTFIVDAASMATLGLIQEGTHYAWVSGSLFLNFRGVEAARAAWYKTRGDSFPSPGLRSLRKLAIEKAAAPGSYVLDTDARCALGDDKRPHGVRIAPAKLPERLRADEFPMKTSRAWGGVREGSGRPAAGWSAADWRARGRGRDDDEGQSN